MKKHLITFCILSLLLTACSTQENPSKKTSLLEFHEDEISFSYPKGWQILSMANIYAIEPEEEWLESVFESPVIDLKVIDINFERGHHIDPEEGGRDYYVDIRIKDSLLEEAPASSQVYAESMVPESERISTYTSRKGISFSIWEGEGAYGPFVIYITEHPDSETDAKRFLEISSSHGNTYEEIKEKLQPIVESLELNAN